MLQDLYIRARELDAQFDVAAERDDLVSMFRIAEQQCAVDDEIVRLSAVHMFLGEV